MKMLRILAALLCLSFGIVPAVSAQGYRSLGATSLSVTSASANVALPAGTAGTTITVLNVGSAEAFINFGGSTVTATTSNESIPASSARCFQITTQAYIAGITASSTSTLRVSQGNGDCTVALGGAPAGGAVSSNQGTPGSVNAGWPVIGGELTPDTTGTFTNATQTTNISASGLDGYGTALVSINGTYGTATGVFELSDDGGTTWYSVQGSRINSCVVETGYTSLTNTNQVWTFPVSGADSFRVRSTAVASGTANLRISISSAVPPSSTSVCGTVTANLGGQYPSGATPVTATATGTTAATTATLAGTAGKTTYICGFSITADATSAIAGNATVTGPIGGTMTFIQGVGTATAPTTLDKNFGLCIPASGQNVAIAVVSAAAGTLGNTAVNAWGYQL